MSDSDKGKIGDGKKGKTDPKSLPTDAIQLLQMQTAQSMDVMHELVRQMSKLKTKGIGGGGGGDSDPESSDSFNEDGTPKMRGGPWTLFPVISVSGVQGVLVIFSILGVLIL